MFQQWWQFAFPLTKCRCCCYVCCDICNNNNNNRDFIKQKWIQRTQFAVKTPDFSFTIWPNLIMAQVFDSIVGTRYGIVESGRRLEVEKKYIYNCLKENSLPRYGNQWSLLSNFKMSLKDIYDLRKHWFVSTYNTINRIAFVIILMDLR